MLHKSTVGCFVCASNLNLFDFTTKMLGRLSSDVHELVSTDGTVHSAFIQHGMLTLIL